MDACVVQTIYMVSIFLNYFIYAVITRSWEWGTVIRYSFGGNSVTLKQELHSIYSP
jgi:hypothetical protein